MELINMNKTVELVNLWGNYEMQYPNGSIEEFCRFYLSSQVKEEKQFPSNGDLVPDVNGQLIILITKISRFYEIYSNKALEGTGIAQIEEFGLLVIIYNKKNPTKSEVIYDNLLELSSGTNMLIRLIKRGLITEYTDKNDKRVKRLNLTLSGENALKIAIKQVIKVEEMMVNGLTEKEKELFLQILNPICETLSGVFKKQKNKNFEDIYKENM